SYSSPAGHHPSLNDLGALDNDVFERNVLKHGAPPGLHLLDLVHHIAALDDTPEHTVSPAIRGGGGVVQKLVVGDVDEELRGRRVRVGGARHRYGVGSVLKPVVGFVLYRRARRLLTHAAIEAPALNHESVYDAVKQRIAEVPVLHVLKEIRNGGGGALAVELKSDDAVVGVQFDHLPDDGR